jgi:hypothetical protein
MSTVKIGVRGDEANFRPGQIIEGAAGWELVEPARAIEVRLFWHTRGKGTEDVVVVDRVRFENPAMQDAQPFRFTAPDQPSSFSGRLISVLWALELVVLPKGPSARQELVIAPLAREIVLGDATGVRPEAFS